MCLMRPVGRSFSLGSFLTKVLLSEPAAILMHVYCNVSLRISRADSLPVLMLQSICLLKFNCARVMYTLLCPTGPSVRCYVP